jgi:hypothetical protein
MYIGCQVLCVILELSVLESKLVKFILMLIKINIKCDSSTIYCALLILWLPDQPAFIVIELLMPYGWHWNSFTWKLGCGFEYIPLSTCIFTLLQVLIFIHWSFVHLVPNGAETLIVYDIKSLYGVWTASREIGARLIMWLLLNIYYNSIGCDCVFIGRLCIILTSEL